MKNHRLIPPFLALLAAFALTFSAQAQVIVIRIGQHPGNSSALNNWSPAEAPRTATASSQAPRYVQEIMSTMGLKPNFEVRAARIDNAAAVVYGGQRYILYNPTFIDNLVQRTGNKWAAVSVLAHEIGHHLDGHTVASAGSQPQLELEADEFSGYVLRKMGASLSDAQAAMKTIATEKGSATHPGRSARLASIAAGWSRANGSPANNVAVNEPQEPVRSYPARSYPTTVSTRSTSPLSSQDILGRLSFNADPRTPYYVTTNYNVVKVVNNRIYVVGKLGRLNNRSYPYVLYDESNTKLLVHANGTVVNRDGKAVGALRNA
ncbi:MAG: membrane-binding protein [Chitinophagaceae bacterium]|nr:MAG: membrane-binding protein [Chitinophagaceae bacterium]